MGAFAKILVGGVILAAAAATGPAIAQQPSAASLAARASVVVQGTVVRANASDEPLVPPSPRTVVIKVSRMYAGADIAGDQAGRTATVILTSGAAAKPGADMLFFGEPRFAGKTLTIADIGELAAAPTLGATKDRAALDAGLQARRDLPIRDRLSVADAVFRGVVEKVETPAKTTDGPRGEAVSEHDPEFRLAWVRVKTAIRGVEAGALAPVVFPASRDIVWFNVPKLKPGDEVIVLGHRPREEEAREVRDALAGKPPSGVLLVTAPYDVLPPSEEKRVVDILRAKGSQ